MYPKFQIRILLYLYILENFINPAFISIQVTSLKYMYSFEELLLLIPL